MWANPMETADLAYLLKKFGTLYFVCNDYEKLQRFNSFESP